MNSGEDTQRYPAGARAVAAVIAALALGSFLLGTVASDEPLVEAVLGRLRFFTIWCNLAAGFIFAWIAAGRRIAPAILAALATALAIVASVYWGLLSGDHRPVGIDRLTNQSDHTLVPLLAIGWWLVSGPRVASIPRALPVIMAAPVLYAIFALVVGSWTGFYAYFFLDRAALGWLQLGINIAALAALFAVTGLLLIGVKRTIHRRS